MDSVGILEGMLANENAEPTDLPITLLKAITRDFSDELQIGNGGFAVVYKGLLQNGWTVAVKKLHNSIDLDESKYIQEVGCLMRVKHTNIVRFLGYCADTQGIMLDWGGNSVMADVRERLLCFEYLPNGSLDKYISDASSGLKWTKRYQIIKGICEGLRYLHGQRIVHRDLKPANILLDDDMVPKVSDFGISRCFDQNQTRDITSTLLGSVGYLAPEFFRGVISTKLDIYSLGVILTELLTGKKGYTPVESVLERWSKQLNTSTGESLLEQVRVCAEISIECIDPDPAKRPVMERIVYMLNEIERKNEFVENDLSTTSVRQQPSTVYIDDIDNVKLEAIARNKWIPRMACTEIPVLVRVTAPERLRESWRIGLDLVAVLNLDEGEGDWNNRLKQAMIFVINNLGIDDRLSIITFNSSQVHRCMELSIMSDVNREVARSKVHELKGGNNGYSSICKAIEEATMILGQRKAEEITGRVGRIILVFPEAKLQEIKVSMEHISSEFPIETFCRTSFYESGIFHDISNKTSGVYSRCEDIDTALAQCIGGLTSVTAMDVEIHLKTVNGVTISSVDHSGYKAVIDQDDDGCRSGTILVHDLYAGEKKNFIVWLSAPKDNQEQLMTVTGHYRNPMISKEATVRLSGCHVAVIRPATTTAPWDETTVFPKVAAELIRLRLMKVISDMGRKNCYDWKELKDSWDAIKASEDWRVAAGPTRKALASDVKEMERGFYVIRDPVPYFNMWMSSNLLQRANTKYSLSQSGAFRTAAMEDMLKRLLYPSVEG